MLDRKRGKNVSQDGRNSVSGKFYLHLSAFVFRVTERAWLKHLHLLLTLIRCPFHYLQRYK